MEEELEVVIKKRENMYVKAKEEFEKIKEGFKEMIEKQEAFYKGALKA